MTDLNITVEVRRNPATDRPGTKTRVYIFHDRETILDNLMQRHRRPVDAYRSGILPTVLKQAGLEGMKAKWSQRAGCSCGCSPGFILDGHRDHTIFVHLK